MTPNRSQPPISFCLTLINENSRVLKRLKSYFQQISELILQIKLQLTLHLLAFKNLSLYGLATICPFTLF